MTESLRAAPSPPHRAPASWPMRPKRARTKTGVRPKTPAAVPAVPHGRRAVLVDIDGTVALMGSRSPYDWGKVGADTKNRPVLAVVTALAAAGNKVVFLTGRDEVCRPETTKWLRQHTTFPFTGPFLRAAGDTRKDRHRQGRAVPRARRRSVQRRRGPGRPPTDGRPVALTGSYLSTGSRGEFLTSTCRLS